MIIRFFKASYFSRLIALLLLIFVLWIPEPLFLTSITSTFYLPIAPWLQQILTILLFFLTALFFNKTVAEKRLSERNSYLTAFFFILIGSGTVFLTQLTPFLPATFFFAFFYQKVFNFQNSSKIITTSFDAGLLLGLASLFYPPVALMIIFVWVALLVYQIGQWRAYVSNFLGMLIPWFFLLSGYLWIRKLPEVQSDFIQYFHVSGFRNPFISNYDLALFLLVALTSLIATFYLVGKLSSFNISMRQHTLVGLWSLFFCSLIVFLFARHTQALMLTALPAALVISAFFSRIKKLKWANFFVLLWMLFIFVNHFLPLFHAA